MFIILIGCISILASSDIQSLDSYLRNPNELQVVLESYKKWNILQIPSQKIWFINKKTKILAINCKNNYKDFLRDL